MDSVYFLSLNIEGKNLQEMDRIFVKEIDPVGYSVPVLGLIQTNLSVYMYNIRSQVSVYSTIGLSS